MDKRPHAVVFHGARELFSIALRGVEKLKDKYIWTKQEVEEAHGYLLYFRDTVKKEDEKLFHKIFGESGDFFDLEPFARGYNAKVLSFKTIMDGKVKKWVIKVGFRIAPVVDFGDPSSEAYFTEYQVYLNLLRKEVKRRPSLKHLLPEPQAILWANLEAEDGRKLQTTLAIQPFVNVIRPRELKKTITRQERQSLLSELIIFKEMSRFLTDQHEVAPELIGEGNLEIGRIGKSYHLILLDMGWVDLKKQLPISHTIAHFSSKYVLGRLENWLKNRNATME